MSNGKSNIVRVATSMAKRNQEAKKAAEPEVNANGYPVGEFDGVFLNPGIFVKDEEDNDVFQRLDCKGIAVDSLKIRPVYANMSPAFRAIVEAENRITRLIHTQTGKLAPGEGVIVNIPVQMYRRQEAENQLSDDQEYEQSDEELADKLFG